MKKKSHSGAKKRVKFNKNGKMFFKKAGRKHLLINKSKRQKKLNQKTGMPVPAQFVKSIRKMLPYN
jgi:large subunit ribosomal protein L35